MRHLVSEANRRRMVRLGVVLLVLGLGIGIPAIVETGFEALGVAFIAISSVFVIVGVGLLVGSHFARWAGLVFFVLFGGLIIWEWGKLLISILPHATWSMDFILRIANSAATTLLLLWLNIRAIQILLDSARKDRTFTSRLTGVLLVIVGLAHLKIASTLGFSAPGFQFTISLEGTYLYGFSGWAYWHVVAVPLGLCLISGWRRMQPVAVLILLLLVALLWPLSLFTVWNEARAFGGTHLSMMVFVGLGPLLFAYLCWWLWREQGVELRALNPKDLVIAIVVLGSLVVVTALLRPNGQVPGGMDQGRIEAARADFEREDFEREDFEKEDFEREEGERRAAENLIAPPLNEATIPSTNVWYCGSSLGPNGHCDFTSKNCEDLNGDSCEEFPVAWCFTYLSSEREPDWYSCHPTESSCVSSRSGNASRCQISPNRDDQTK